LSMLNPTYNPVCGQKIILCCSHQEVTSRHGWI
jgi:hypothetical protein